MQQETEVQEFLQKDEGNLDKSATVLHGENQTVSTFEGCPSESEQQGKASICEGCPGQALCQSAAGRTGKNPEQDQLDVRMRAIKHKILVISGKGGTFLICISLFITFPSFLSIIFCVFVTCFSLRRW